MKDNMSSFGLTKMDQSDVHIDESFVEKKFETDASRFERKYGQYMDEASDVFNKTYGKFNRSWSVHDTVGLGQFLESYENYLQIAEADVTSRDQLGDYMKVGLGLAAIQYVSMPASFLASVQPMSDEVGMVYFRELVATTTRGSITQNDVIGSQGGKLSENLDTYYQEKVTTTKTISNAATPYTATLGTPVRERTIEISMSVTVGATTTTYAGLDDGNGYIIGNWPTPAGLQCGTINYTNGALVINLTDTGATGTISITYYQNLAQATTIPGFLYRLVAKAIRANYFILENQYSTLADYSVRRRFGRALSDDVASAAVAQINSAVLSAMIRMLVTAGTATGTVTWDATPDPGVAVALHRQTFTDSLEAAAQLIDAATGRGAISFILAGSYARRIMRTLGVEMVRKPTPGPYLCGFMDNVPVFYAPQTLIGDQYAIVGYRGNSWFEAPIVYAPYLPIVMVKGTGDNPFNRITGVAHAAGVDTVVPGFCARISIENMTA